MRTEAVKILPGGSLRTFTKNTDTCRATVYEDAGVEVTARVVNCATGEGIRQTDVSAIHREIFDLDSNDPDISMDSEALTVADAVYNSCIVDGRCEMPPV